MGQNYFNQDSDQDCNPDHFALCKQVLSECSTTTQPWWHTVRSQRETTSHQSHTPACQDWMSKHIHTSYSEKSERNNIPSVAYPSESGLNEQTYTHIIQWEVREKQHPISRIPQRVRTEWTNIYTHHTVRSQRETTSHQSHTPACQDWMNKHIHTSFAYSQITHSLLVFSYLIHGFTSISYFNHLSSFMSLARDSKWGCRL